MRLNHFPLNLGLAVFKTTYLHRNPRGFLGFVRSQGLTAERVGEEVCVYHGLPHPEFRGATAQQRTWLTPDDADYDRGVLSLIGQTLLGAGYLLTGRERAAVHPTQQRVPLRTPRQLPAEIAVNAHLRWEWELERHSGQGWLVLRPGRMFLSALSWHDRGMKGWAQGLPGSVPQLHALCLHSGRRERLRRMDGSWAFQREDRAKEGLWHLSFSTKALSDLNLSGDAHHAASLSMPDVQRLVNLPGLWQPFVTSLEVLEVPGQVIEGERLRFGRGTGRDVTDVHKRGILHPPPQPVRLAVVPPVQADERANEQLRQELLAHLLPREVVLRNQDASQGLRKHLNRKDSDDTLYSFWSAGEYRKLGLEPFDLVRDLHKYEPGTGRLLAPEKLRGAAAEAREAGRQLIGLMILPDTIGRAERDALSDELGRLGVKKLLHIRRDMLNRPRAEYMAWVNVAVKLAQRAGAVPWDLEKLPGVCEQTFFVGVDLGHDHREKQSVPAFSLHEFRGRPVDGLTLPRRAGNERLSLAELKQGLSKLLNGKRAAQVIVHRDGKYLEGEVDDFIIALNDLGVSRLSLLAVKKSNLSMVANAEEGTVLPLDDRRCLLVTNTQAAVARPTELEVMHSDHLTFSELTEQVFWLTRVFMNNAQHAGSDPATVEWANGIARTGKRVALSGWSA
ncbi:hypothetical protein SAMN04488058_11912 [Deinococcus reticulitermitis]|uniref:Protein argonaute n=1 Tax=Deinococcus reticulitermitis TaxID=856736 RepID=A0A1H7BP89_9DEIO|nr:hypothetical protein [Deinococcus reticulitermitis]SEJ79543.1 hypothetical protein SAMN04488058_11912 [Deinococcus reticulitermitis]